MATFRLAQIAVDNSGRLAIVTDHPNRYRYLTETDFFGSSGNVPSSPSGTLSSSGVVPDTTTQRLEFADGNLLVATRKRMDLSVGEGMEMSLSDDSLNNEAKISISVDQLTKKFRAFLVHYVETFGTIPTGLENDWAIGLSQG